MVGARTAPKKRQAHEMTDVIGSNDLSKLISRPLRTEEDYEKAIFVIDRLLEINPEEGTVEDDLLDLLSVLVEAYEDEHETWTHEKVSPQAVVRFMAEQKEMSQGELAELLGGRSRLSDFMKEKRQLSRTQIKALRDALGIPADLLIGLLIAFVSAVHLAVG
jgi:HTH-type transcriptional regulator/antitoxin HigA